MAASPERLHRDPRSATNGHVAHEQWLGPTRVVLQPIAAPSILGLFAFAGSTFIVAATLAGWYGTAESR